MSEERKPSERSKGPEIEPAELPEHLRPPGVPKPTHHSKPQQQRQPSTSCGGKKKKRSKPLQNKKRKLQKFKGVPPAKGKKPRK